MKKTYLTAHSVSPRRTKVASLRGFWKVESLKNYCKRRKWTPSCWSHAYVTAEGVHEVKQGNFVSTTTVSSFRDYAAEMGIG